MSHQGKDEFFFDVLNKVDLCVTDDFGHAYFYLHVSYDLSISSTNLKNKLISKEMFFIALIMA